MDLVVQRATKAHEISSHILEELEAKHESAASLWDQLKEAELQATLVLGLYRDALGHFGGSTSAPPRCRDFAMSLAWLKFHIIKLPDFIGGAIDFGALVGVSSFGRLLRRDSCNHVESEQKENVASGSNFGENPSVVWRSVCNFIGSFWAKIGRAEAKSMAEAWCLVKVQTSLIVGFGIDDHLIRELMSFVEMTSRYSNWRMCNMVVGTNNSRDGFAGLLVV